jgi:hypothetical protein
VPFVKTARRAAWLSDVEGQWDKLESFCAGNPVVSLAGDALTVAPGCLFVFGGDAVDRGPAGQRILRALVAVKSRQPEQVVLLAGNRDINKLRLCRELRGAPPLRTPPEVRAAPRGEILKWIFENTMGAKQAFRHRAAELAARRSVTEVTDDAVAQSYLDDLAEGGAMREFLAQAQLAWREGITLYLHGGVSAQNLGVVPGRPRCGSPDEWALGLNDFYRRQIGAFLADDWSDPHRTPGWQELVAYQAPLSGTRLNQASVVYARPTDDDGNPLLPERAVEQRLAEAGIFRAVVGHTPSGDSPAVLRGETLELVLADNSYGRQERGSQLLLDDDGLDIAGSSVLDDGAVEELRFRLERAGASPVGRLALETGELVKSPLARGSHLLYRSLPGYRTAQRSVDGGELARLTLVEPRRQG